MASIFPLISKLLFWEGGEKYTNDPDDPGGPTRFGITLSTWKLKGEDPDKDKDGDVDADDVKLLTKEDFLVMTKQNFWDKAKADFINNQSVAEYIVDWGFNAGMAVPIKATQRILGLLIDGQCGPKTVQAINAHDQQELHDRLVNARVAFYEEIIQRNPVLVKYRKGWLRRALSYKFEQ